MEVPDTMTHWLTTGASLAVLCCFGLAQEPARSAAPPVASIVEAVEKAQAGLRPESSYRVIREYRLFSANPSKADSDVVAEVDFRLPAKKDYRIQKSSGSERGQQVVRRVLDHEVEAASNGNQTRIALSRENYEFTYVGETILDNQPCYVLRLMPKRNEKDLISGEAWIDKRSFFVRQIEGEAAKTPSWWLRKVRIKLAFADFDGTWLQTSMEAVADVRIAGLHTLTSRILDYQSIDEVASTTIQVPRPNRKP
jgi:hypothetical protein